MHSVRHAMTPKQSDGACCLAQLASSSCLTAKEAVLDIPSSYSSSKTPNADSRITSTSKS